MRGGEVPIHIQRWAPADFQADEHVKFWLFERDYEVYVFYRQFIDVSFIQGGDLPADPRRLAAVLSLPLEVVERGLSACLGTVVHEDGERLFQRRVRKDIERELAFREKQAEAGKKSGKARRKKASKSSKNTNDDSGSNQTRTVVQSGTNQTRTKREPNANPPAPAPTPTSTPEKTPPGPPPKGASEQAPPSGERPDGPNVIHWPGTRESTVIPEPLMEAIPEFPALWCDRMKAAGQKKPNPSAEAKQLAALVERLPKLGAAAIRAHVLRVTEAGWQTIASDKLDRDARNGSPRLSPDLERRRAGYDQRSADAISTALGRGSR